MERACDDCDTCCHGYLKGEAYGKPFNKGVPCFFLKKGCSIYEDRPKLCKDYKCSWLSEDFLPMWMRPDLSKVIVSKHTAKNGIEYYSVVEAGEPIKSYILNYIFTWAVNNKANLYYEVSGGMNKFGSKEFLEMEIE